MVWMLFVGDAEEKPQKHVKYSGASLPKAIGTSVKIWANKAFLEIRNVSAFPDKNALD